MSYFAHPFARQDRSSAKQRLEGVSSTAVKVKKKPHTSVIFHLDQHQGQCNSVWSSRRQIKRSDSEVYGISHWIQRTVQPPEGTPKNSQEKGRGYIRQGFARANPQFPIRKVVTDKTISGAATTKSTVEVRATPEEVLQLKTVDFKCNLQSTTKPHPKSLKPEIAGC